MDDTQLSNGLNGNIKGDEEEVYETGDQDKHASTIGNNKDGKFGNKVSKKMNLKIPDRGYKGRG